MNKHCILSYLFFPHQFRAKQLYHAGYKTLAHLANADPSVLVKTVENLYKRQANQIVASARVSTLQTFLPGMLDLIFGSDCRLKICVISKHMRSGRY